MWTQLLQPSLKNVSFTILGGVPRGLVTFWRIQSPAQLFLMSENKRSQNSKSGDRHVTLTDAAPVWDCCPSPLSSRPGPVPISSHYSVTWNQEGKGSEKRNHDHLFHLLNESNFLPQSTRRAHTSVATQNYLTLIRINKSRCDQDSAVAWRQTLTAHLYCDAEA